jgi:glycerophosphoryl diester phosphodiesterase
MKIISHRGKIDKINNQENNRKAIHNFMDSHTQMIEIDIQLTKDNKIILFHDEEICNEEIINKDSNDLILNYDMILLKEVLDIVKGNKSIYLDIKNKKLNDKQINIFFSELFCLLEKYFSIYQCDKKSIYICSFYEKYINYILKSDNAKKYNIGIILDKDNINYFLHNYYYSINNFDFVSIDYTLLDSISFCMNKIPIFCYTVNDIKDYLNLSDKKYISGIITDMSNIFNEIKIETISNKIKKKI